MAHLAFWSPANGIESPAILFVADLFHPLHGFSVEYFLNGDVRHGRGRRGAVPMFFTGSDPDHITRPNFLDRATPALRQTTAGRHYQGLAQRMGVPCCPSPGLERDAGANARARSFAWNRGSIRTTPVKYSAGPLLEGCEPIRLISIFRIPSSDDTFAWSAWAVAKASRKSDMTVAASSFISVLLSIQRLMVGSLPRQTCAGEKI